MGEKLDAEIKGIIKPIQEEYIPKKRILERRKYEDLAREIITKHIGKLTKEHVEKVVDLIDSDYWEDEKCNKRFGLMLWGRNRKLIIANKEERLNQLFSEIFEKERLDEVEVLMSDLKGVGDGFVSCLLYLKNRNSYNILINATAEGIRTAFPEEPELYGSFKDRYQRFNKMANKLKKECSLQPQEVDIVLTVLPGMIPEVKEKEAIETVKTIIAKPEVIKVENLTHTDVQGILVELGNLLGYKTYVADPSKLYKGKRLKDWITLPEVPPFTFPRLLNAIKGIDVIWFLDEGNEFPAACFEIEHTTDVTKGLLRLYQISRLGTKLFIIAPSEVKSKFETEVNKNPFYEIKDRYIFRSYKQLAEFFESAKKYYNLKESFHL